MFPSFLSVRLRRLRRFPFTWWMAVISVALVAGFVVATSVSRATADAARYDGLTTVYVARHALSAGTVLSESDISLQSRPRAFVPEKSVTNNPTSQVIDAPVSGGDVITQANTGASGLSPTASLLHVGEQGIAVAISDSSPTFQIGDNVSVIATPNSNDVANNTPAVVVTDQARVINVTDHAVTIAVSAGDAPKVAFAEAKSAVNLAITAP